MVLASGSACSKAEANPDAPTPGTPVQAANVVEASTALTAAAKFQAEAFDVALVSVGSFKAGQPAQLEIQLSAKSPYKCNDKYPYKFKAKPTPDVEFTEPVVRMEKGKLTKMTFTLPIAFTPKTSGAKSVEGQFSFSVCTEDRCLVERRDLKLAINVE